MNYLLFAVLALIASASNTVFNRISANKVGTLVSATIKAFFIVIAAFIITCCLGDFKNIATLNKSEWIWVIILGLITSIDWIFYFLSIKRAHLESFAPFEASAVLFFSNLLFMLFEFSAVTNKGSFLSTLLFYSGLGFLLGAMAFAALNKKINPKTKKIWILYATLTSLAMGFTVVVVKAKLGGVKSSVISFYQMVVVFVVCGVMTLVSGAFKEFKNIKLKDYGKFFIAAVFNALLMVLRYMALNSATERQVPIVNCIIAFDFVLVSLGTVLFFKEKNKAELCVLILLVTCGMALNVIAQLI